MRDRDRKITSRNKQLTVRILTVIKQRQRDFRRVTCSFPRVEPLGSNSHQVW